MSRYGKIIGVMTLFSCIFLWSPASRAQPLGIMGQQPRDVPRQEVLSTPAGRYVFGQISDSGKDKFMLDTYTGRLWQIAETGGLGVHLRPVPYRQEDGKCAPIPDAPQQKAVEKAKE